MPLLRCQRATHPHERQENAKKNASESECGMQCAGRGAVDQGRLRGNKVRGI